MNYVQPFSSYLTENLRRVHYEAHLVYGYNKSRFCESYETTYVEKIPSSVF
jgi:hypothetical protein